MELVDALSQLGFSFWQVLILVVLYFFKSEISNIFERVISIKLKDAELTFSGRGKEESIDSLREVAHEIEKEGASNTVVKEKIDSAIRKKRIGSLINIKSGTTYMWNSLVKNIDNTEPFEAAIRYTTFNRIAGDFNLLEKDGFIEIISGPGSGSGNYFHLKLRIIKTSELKELVEIASEY